MPSTERERHPEREPRAYVQCAQFPDADSAGHVYAALQQTIFESRSELSCFRLQLNTAWHAVVLGEPPPRGLAGQIETLLAQGEPTTLPDEVLSYLQLRRADAIASGSPWTERHYRPPQTR
mgnify:CR=1 FL=1